MEPCRPWHDPVVEIYSNLITPGLRCAANGYDLANRRWYCLKVEAETEDDPWLASEITRHLREYYAAHQSAPPWNTIHTDAQGSGATFETQPVDLVARPIGESLQYGGGPAEQLPTIKVDDLRNLTYISRSADRCSWNGTDCVFKRIEFDVDVRVIEDEIRTRETLLRAIGPVPAAQMATEIIKRFCLVPVVAVVIATREPWKIGSVAGLLMPYGGQDLEICARGGKDIPLRVNHLRNLVR